MSNELNEIMSIKNVSLRYDGENKDNQVHALDNINLSIKEKDFVCLLGASGCGKSSLLNLMAGLLVPSEGQITMLGEPVTGTDWRRAVVFQTPTLYPWLNVHDNVAFGPKARGIKKEEVEPKVSKYLDLVGLHDFGKNKPYELSGGMKQRVALARVLVNDPSMILMDEPFGALDALTRLNMHKLMRTIWDKNGNTVFLITHDVDEALSLGTRVIVMSPRPGRIMNEFELNFTRQIIEEGNDNVRYTEEYLDLRKTILSTIG